MAVDLPVDLPVDLSRAVDRAVVRGVRTRVRVGDRGEDAVGHLDLHRVAHVVDVLDLVAQHLSAQPVLQVGDQRRVVGVDHVERDLQLPLVHRCHDGVRAGAVADVDQRGLAHVVDVVDLVVQHGAAQSALQVGDQGGLVGVHDVQMDVHAAGALAQALAVDDRHGAQQQHVDQHDEPAVGDVHPVDQAHHQGDEVVGDLLLGHRRRPQPDDRQDGEQAEAQCDVHPHRGQQRDRHEDADVERAVGQQQVRAPVATEVQHVGQQEDRCDVDGQVGCDFGVCGEHLGTFRVIHFLPAILPRITVLSYVVGSARLCNKTPLPGGSPQSTEGPHHGLRSRRAHGLSTRQNSRGAVHCRKPEPLTSGDRCCRLADPPEVTPRTRGGGGHPPALGRPPAHSGVGITLLIHRWGYPYPIPPTSQQPSTPPDARPGRSPTTTPQRTTSDPNTVRRRDRLGGLLHEYQQVA